MQVNEIKNILQEFGCTSRIRALAECLFELQGNLINLTFDDLFNLTVNGKRRYKKDSKSKVYHLFVTQNKNLFINDKLSYEFITMFFSYASPKKEPITIVSALKFLETQKEKIFSFKAAGLNPQIDTEDMDDFSTCLLEELLTTPSAFIGKFNKLIKTEFNLDVSLQFVNLPDKKKISNLTSSDLNKFISIRGDIIRISSIKNIITDALFACKKCGTTLYQKQTNSKLTYPDTICKECERKDYKLLEQGCIKEDYQEILIQESIENLNQGEQPQQLKLVFVGNVVREPLNLDVVVNGILKDIETKPDSNIREIYLLVNSIEYDKKSIEISSEDEDEIIAISKNYTKLVESFCSRVYGFESAKLAILLQLFGGASTERRNWINILLIGDPSVGKTDLLLFAVKLDERGQYVSGKSITAGGLTSIATQDKFTGGWALIPGILPTCHNHLCAIDEFTRVSKVDIQSIHESMENGTISVAKAGIIRHFMANTAILAAANPRGDSFNNYQYITELYDIDKAILTRFDLIFPIKDSANPKTDSKIADRILNLDERKDSLSIDIMKKYITYAKENYFPIMPLSVKEKIKSYWLNLRSTSVEGKRAENPRGIPSIQRLAEAMARMRLSNTVSEEDVDKVIELKNYESKLLCTDEDGDIDRNIIEGTPRNQRDKIYKIESIIKDLCKENELANLNDIIEKSYESKITETEVKKIINELKIKGILLEPREEKFKHIG